MAFISLKAFPQRVQTVFMSLNALHKNFFRVEQMARDAESFVFFSALAQQIEKVQASQLVGGLRSINKAFEHDKLTDNTFLYFRVLGLKKADMLAPPWCNGLTR
jgi:hypothetical protein